jgi:RimJ/RimL family protein N-acetyltransferase
MDFGLARVRPIRRDDADALVAFHDRLSRQSQYLRFFTVHPHLSPAEVQRFTRVDYHDRLALVVEANGELIAVGRYDRIDGTSEAEVAFVVADSYQRHGLGTLLLRRLAEAAAARGITRFVAETLPENQLMHAVFRESGFDVRSVFGDGVVRVTFPIEAPER